MNPAVALVAEIFGSVELTSFGAKSETLTGSGDYLAGGFEASYTKRVFPLEALIGLKLYLAASSYFAFGAGIGLTGIGATDHVGAPDVRAFASFIFEPTVGDRDDETE